MRKAALVELLTKPTLFVSRLYIGTEFRLIQVNYYRPTADLAD